MPPALVADATKAREALGWQAKWTNIDEVVRSAWNWFEAHPNGYGD